MEESPQTPKGSVYGIFTSVDVWNPTPPGMYETL